MFTIGHRLLNGTLVAALLLAAAPAFVQQASAGEGIGVVTAIQGQAAVSRASLPQPAALRFKDDVFFRDEIATRERSTVRLLLGGKGTLMIREQSQVTLDESVAPDGGRRSVLSLIAGKIGAAIAHALMRPGESVEIHTPNAVAAVRGTVLIAEYIPPQGSAANSQPVLLASAGPGPFLAQGPGPGGTSVFVVLTGSVTITPQGQPPLTLGPLQGVTITTTPGGVQAGAIQTITPAQAAQAAQGLEAGKSHRGEAEGTAQAQAELAAALAGTILQATGGGPATNITAPNPPNNTAAPVVPSALTTENVLPAGPLLSLNNVTLGLDHGTSVATFDGGSANTVTPLSLSGGGIEDIVGVSGTPLKITGNSITHVGSIVALTGAGLVGAPDGTPVVKITGTTVTNTGGSLFDMSGGSALATFGPVLATQDATLNVGSSVVSMNGSAVVTSGTILDFVNSNVTVNGPVFSVLNGSIVYASGSPMVRLSGSTLTAAGDLGNSDETGNVVVISAPTLDATNSTISLGSYRLPEVTPHSDMTTFSPPAGVPQVNLTNSTLSYARTVDWLDFGSGSTSVRYAGLLLTATDSTITLAGSFTELWSEDNVTSNGIAPLIQLTRSALSVGSNLLGVDDGGYLMLFGPFLSATGLDGSNRGLAIGGDVIGVSYGGNLYTGSTFTSALIQLNNTSLTSGNFLNVYGLGGPTPGTAHMEIYGPLLQATNSSLTVSGSLVRIDQDGYFQSYIGSGSSLITLTGGTHSIDGGGGGSLLQYYAGSSEMHMFWPGGTFLTADGATINLKGSGNAIKVDTAALTASAPIISLINNSTLNTSPTGDSINGAMWVNGSSVTFTGTGSVFNLDRSILNVQNGPLLSLTGGSSMTVSGDFATLINGSKITVQNGPLISVDNYATLTVTGALVNFGGTGGNQLIINNSISPNYVLNGVPVSKDAYNISISGSPIKNPSLGTATVNGVSFPNSGPYTGSVIKATNGGSVTIGGGY